MKMFNLKSAITSVLSVALAVVFATQAFAMAPNLTLTSSGNGIIQVTVYADANANVILDYYSGGQLLGAGMIGQTNYSGYFSSTINANSYSIPSGAQVIVMVNGQQSIPATWPSNGYNNNGCVYNCPPVYNNNNQVTLSVSNLNLSIGQTQAITINNNNLYNTYYNGGQYYVSTTGNNSVANATVSGSTLTLYGQSVGSTTLSVCSNNNGNYGYSSYNNGCATLYVTVTDTNYNYNYPYTYNTPTYPTNYQYNTYPYTTYNSGYNSAPLNVSNSNVQVTVGNSGVVTLYGNNTANNNVYPYTTTGYNNYNYGSNYYITNNNSGVANATVNGNTLTIYGTAAGNTSVNVCSSEGNQCATVNVTVIAPMNNYYINNGVYNNYNSPYDYPTDPGNWYYSYPDHCWHRQN